MPISTTCPNCKAIFRLPEDLAGKKVKCQKCQQLFVVPEGNAETVAAGASVASEVEAAPPVPQAMNAPPPTPLPPAPLYPAPPVPERAEDKEAIEERESESPPPLPNKRRPLSEPRRRDQEAKAASGSGMMAIVLAFLGLSVLLCVVCTGAGVGIYVLRPEPKKPVVIRDKGKRDFMFKDKFDDRPINAKDFEFKDFKDFPKDVAKDGMIVPPVPAGPEIAVVFGADGVFRSDNNLRFQDQLRGDRHFKVYNARFEAGKRYQVDMMSNELDSYLIVIDDRNMELMRDDDSGGNLNSQLFFIPQRTANYRILATTFGPGETGAYTLIVRRH